MQSSGTDNQHRSESGGKSHPPDEARCEELEAQRPSEGELALRCHVLDCWNVPHPEIESTSALAISPAEARYGDNSRHGRDPTPRLRPVSSATQHELAANTAQPRPRSQMRESTTNGTCIFDQSSNNTVISVFVCETSRFGRHKWQLAPVLVVLSSQLRENSLSSPVSRDRVGYVVDRFSTAISGALYGSTLHCRSVAEDPSTFRRSGSSLCTLSRNPIGFGRPYLCLTCPSRRRAFIRTSSTLQRRWSSR